jgi:hypothetical protein
VIGRDEIAEVCRNNDAIAEEHHDLPEFYREYGVDILGLAYVANQRALRAAMILDSQNPNLIRPKEVHLSTHIQMLLPMFASIFMDGFTAGLIVKET